ncbi:MAG: hypothetical protein IKP90_02170 [Fibrobacter sp.]|jgi:hypothetical protein|nr:hypothetical protein [Fibrobacter sp.]
MRKLLPYLFSFLAVAVLAAYIVYEGYRELRRVAPPQPKEEVVEEVEPEEPGTFHGRVELPAVDDILVLSNSADRDIEKLYTYFEGRSAGLHWIAQAYFKKHRHSDDVVVGLRLAIDSLGNFACNGMEFTNAEDESLGEAIRLHIEAYWRYRKSESGTTELWLPVRFRAIN